MDESGPTAYAFARSVAIQADGQISTVWKSDGLVPGAAWSPYLEGSKDLVADWVDKKCGNWNIKTNKCGS